MKINKNDFYEFIKIQQMINELDRIVKTHYINGVAFSKDYFKEEYKENYEIVIDYLTELGYVFADLECTCEEIEFAKKIDLIIKNKPKQFCFFNFKI
jgi:hypothetical protein